MFSMEYGVGPGVMEHSYSLIHSSGNYYYNSTGSKEHVAVITGGSGYAGVLCNTVPHGNRWTQ